MSKYLNKEERMLGYRHSFLHNVLKFYPSTQTLAKEYVNNTSGMHSLEYAKVCTHQLNNF